MSENISSSDLLVVGAGIAGITAAIEAAETGVSVILVEKNAYIGGKVAQFNKYFPKMCPPACGLEINIRRLRTNPSITLYTMAEVTSIKKKDEKFDIMLKLKPRYVNNRCTNCGDCVKACPQFRKNDFNYSMNETTSIYLPYENAYPSRYVIDKETCLGETCSECIEVCKYQAIDLKEQEKIISLETKDVIWAVGWEPYDAKNLDLLGYGKYPDVITNVMMERLASTDGPTKGEILRPSTGEKVNSIAFVQCAGSRDENHLDYCSSVCCMASLKQTKYIREQYPEANIHVHYIDVRSNGLLEEFYNLVQSDEKIHFHRGKVAKIFQDQTSKKLIVEAENSLTGNLMQNAVELVVLATGMKPSTSGIPVDKSSLDKNGFLELNGTTGCGVITRPKDVAATVREATGSVLRVIQNIGRN